MNRIKPIGISVLVSSLFFLGCESTQTTQGPVANNNPPPTERCPVSHNSPTPTTQCPVAHNNHVILVGHGVPAKDFPRDRLSKFFRLEADGGHDHGSDHAHANAEHGHGIGQDPDAERRRLEHEVRAWPRTPQNDPYKFSVENIAEQLAFKSGHEVLVAFNEFCYPTVEQAIETAITDGADRIIVASIMLTPGGGHSEQDIPNSIERAMQLHPEIEIVYAWPYEVDLIVDTLTTQVKSFEATEQIGAAP